MKNIQVAVTQETLRNGVEGMGFTYAEVIEMMAMTNEITTDEVEARLKREEDSETDAYITS